MSVPKKSRGNETGSRFGKPKGPHLDLPAAVDQQVGGLHVAVNHVKVAVQVEEAEEDLATGEERGTSSKESGWAGDGAGKQQTLAPPSQAHSPAG